MAIKINITSEEIALAKKITKEFDAQKTYEKFKCDTNYRGYLGELVLHKYFKAHNVDHEWVEFNKQGYHEPDFIINNITIDLKTTVCDNMWINGLNHDIYIHSTISRDDKLLTLESWMTKKLLSKAKSNGNAEAVIDKFGRSVYVISSRHMVPIETLTVFATANTESSKEDPIFGD